MVICKFWDAGNCRFGQNCRFEHPNTNRAQTSNRFSAFNNLSSGGGFGNGSSDNGSNTYLITKETIEKDLTTERPQWILSAYGPGRDAPEQLFGGSAREQSFEEMRLHHVLAASKGSPQQALNEAQQLYQQAEQQIQTTVGNLDGAIQFIIGAGNNHPNRIDICKQNTLPGGTTGEFLKGNRAQSSFSQASPFQSNSGTNSSNPFSSSAQSSAAFGGNTPSSNTSNPFGQAHKSGASTFGQPSSTSAFGQPNALGQKPSPFGTPAFGQASQPTSAFGQPPPTTSAFGKPAFGQPARPTPASSQPGQPPTTSAFGQASALGQKPSPFGAPAFGQASQPAGGSGAFGQTSTLGQKPNPFGNPSTSSPFGAAANNSNSNTTASPFGGTVKPASPFGGQNQQGASPFGAPSQTAVSNPFSPSPQPATLSPFGQPTKSVTASPFGQPVQGAGASPFGQPAQQPAVSPFGQPTQPATTSPFGQSAQPSVPTANSPFGQSSQSSGAPAATPFTQASHPSPFGQASSTTGNPASSNPFGGSNNGVQAAKPAAAVAGSGGGAGPYPPGSSKQHPDLSSYATKNMDGQLAQWNGKTVTYQDGRPGTRAFNGSWTRIWFPDGAPAYYKDTELPVEAYDEKSKAQWQSFAQTGRFEGGLMPELPPMREACLWNI